MPTLSPTYQEQAPAAVKLSPISPLLKRYKSVMKVITRDASLSNQYKPEVRDIFRSVERWIGEAKIAATSAIFNGWGAEQSDEASRENERWAMEQLCEALTEKGGLVPTSVKYEIVYDFLKSIRPIDSHWFKETSSFEVSWFPCPSPEPYRCLGTTS